jgi:hypothetical protein
MKNEKRISRALWIAARSIAALFFAAGCGATPPADAPREPIVGTATAPEEREIVDAGVPPAPQAAPAPAEAKEAKAPEPIGNVSFEKSAKAGCDTFPSDPCVGRLVSENGLKGMPVEYSACRVKAGVLGDVRKTTVVVDGVRLTFRIADVRRSIEKLFKGNDPSRFPVESAILAAIDAPGGAKELVFSYASSGEADREALDRWGFRLTELTQSSPFEVRDETGALGDHVILYSWSYDCGRLCGAAGHAVYTGACRRIYYSLEMIS